MRVSDHTPAELIAAVFKAFAQHLKNEVPARSITITATVFDPTYGQRETTETVDMVDMAQLHGAIDNFALDLDTAVLLDLDLENL